MNKFLYVAIFKYLPISIFETIGYAKVNTTNEFTFKEFKKVMDTACKHFLDSNQLTISINEKKYRLVFDSFDYADFANYIDKKINIISLENGKMIMKF